MDCVIWSFLNEHPAHKSRAGSGWLVEHVRAPRGRRRGRVEERATRTKDGRSRRETGSKGGWWGPARSVSGWGRAVTSQRKKKKAMPIAASRDASRGTWAVGFPEWPATTPPRRGDYYYLSVLDLDSLSPLAVSRRRRLLSEWPCVAWWVGGCLFFFWSSGSSNRTSTAVAAAGAVPASVRPARHPSRAPEL